MKTDLTTTGSFKAKNLEGYTSKKPLAGVIPNKISKENPDYKLDLASKEIPKAPSVPLPSMPDIPKPDIKLDTAKDIAKDEAIKKAEELKKVEVKPGSVKKPAVFFIKGLDVFSSPSKSEGGYAGVGRMAESVEGARIYGWDQKTEIIEEIKKIHKDYPVILVGHSLGGDTAIEIADELDSLKENFRQIDLLVTMDAVGFGHDIIPQNVKKHLNVFGENGLVLNDGPHVARRDEKTSVRNILSPLDHTDIDDDKETQYEVVTAIQDILKSSSSKVS